MWNVPREEEEVDNVLEWAGTVRASLDTVLEWAGAVQASLDLGGSRIFDNKSWKSEITSTGKELRTLGASAFLQLDVTTLGQQREGGMSAATARGGIGRC